jgi:hypothetical protein
MGSRFNPLSVRSDKVVDLQGSSERRTDDTFDLQL